MVDSGHSVGKVTFDGSLSHELFFSADRIGSCDSGTFPPEKKTRQRYTGERRRRRFIREEAGFFNVVALLFSSRTECC